MKQILRAVIGLLVLALRFNVFANEVIWQEIGRENTGSRVVLVDTDNPSNIYLGSSKGVLKSEDGGQTWRNVLSVKGQNKVVNYLSFGPQDKNSLYAATGNGLFYSSNQGRSWKRIFQGKNPLEDDCTALAILPYAIYLGTKAGLFISTDSARTWYKEPGIIGKSYIFNIVYSPKETDYLYLACLDGVFRSKNKGDSWEKVFTSHLKESADDTEEKTDDQDEAVQFSDIRYLSIDPNNPRILYLATSKGVYKSQDRGENWEMLGGYGLLSSDIRFLLVSVKSHFYAVSKSGIFEYQDERWQELSLRLVAEEIRFLCLDSQDNLYAACDKGLFKANIKLPYDDKENSMIALYFKDEPAIDEVRQAAIKYADVEPEKILGWRKQAKMKAILPKLTVDLDRSESTNYEIYTSATTRYIYEGPRDKSNGYDVTLSWELGDLIWNDAQTSIDVRSRLMDKTRDLNISLFRI